MTNDGISDSGPSLPRLTDRQFLTRVVLSTWLLRLAIVVILQMTDAVFILRLSPDSERYHRFGVVIAQEMRYGNYNWPNWVENGWFQFTGLVYLIVGPLDWAIAHQYNVGIADDYSAFSDN